MGANAAGMSIPPPATTESRGSPYAILVIEFSTRGWRGSNERKCFLYLVLKPRPQQYYYLYE